MYLNIEGYIYYLPKFWLLELNKSVARFVIDPSEPTFEIINKIIKPAIVKPIINIII